MADWPPSLKMVAMKVRIGECYFAAFARKSNVG